MARGWAAALLIVAACSSSAPKAIGPVLPVQDVPAAVRAVEALTVATDVRNYTEINVVPEGVNVFAVTSPGKERAYLYSGGKLGEPGPETTSEGESFTLRGIPLEQAAKVSAYVTKQFKGSTVTQVALVTVKPNGLVWAVRSQSGKGGLVNTLFSPDGQIISALPAN
jgi:uncharacterized protein RhaS with RHS repeats